MNIVEHCAARTMAFKIETVAAAVHQQTLPQIYCISLFTGLRCKQPKHGPGAESTGNMTPPPPSTGKFLPLDVPLGGYVVATETRLWVKGMYNLSS
jgi:hypothetical protein